MSGKKNKNLRNRVEIMDPYTGEPQKVFLCNRHLKSLIETCGPGHFREVDPYGHKEPCCICETMASIFGGSNVKNA